MVCLGNEQRSFCHFWDCIQVLHFKLFCWPWWLLHFFEGFLPSVVDIMVIWIKFTRSSPFSSLIPRMLTFNSCHLLFDHFQFALIHGPDISGSYAILLFTTLDLASVTSHIHNWVLFLLWLHPFILSGVICPLISSSLLGSYWPVEFLFQYPIILPFILFMGFSRQEYWSSLPLQVSLSITKSQSSFKLMSIESMMRSNHLVLCHPLLLPPSIIPSIRVF